MTCSHVNFLIIMMMMIFTTLFLLEIFKGHITNYEKFRRLIVQINPVLIVYILHHSFMWLCIHITRTTITILSKFLKIRLLLFFILFYLCFCLETCITIQKELRCKQIEMPSTQRLFSGQTYADIIKGLPLW